MKINGNVMHSAQKYLDLVTGNYYIVDKNYPLANP